MIEKIVFMQIEDDMVTFEKENGDTIIYPEIMVPEKYKIGDIIKATILENGSIIFYERDTKEMERRSSMLQEKKLSLRERAKKTTNNV